MRIYYDYVLMTPVLIMLICAMPMFVYLLFVFTNATVVLVRNVEWQSACFGVILGTRKPIITTCFYSELSVRLGRR